MSILLLGAGLGATQTRLLDYAPGAAAAYSLRQVGRQYNGPVVRVRRESDSTERDFTASQIDNGTLALWVNATPDLPLDQSSGAAAAYSLRNLSSSYTGNVIRARRASDNDERDFTADEIIDGTLTTWTNASVDLPLDEASGAAAAYSLRNLSASYSGDVVRVRRSSDNAELDFSASEITDGTLESWVGGQNEVFPSVSQSASDFVSGNIFGVPTYPTVTTGVNDPFGGTDAVSIEWPDSSSRRYGTDASGANGLHPAIDGDVTASFWARVPSGTFSLSSYLRSTITPDVYSQNNTITTEWQRFTVTSTRSASNGPTGFYFSEATPVTVEIYGLQLETGSTASDLAISDSGPSGYGYVKTWYDQSGNDNHLAPVAAEGRIVAGGSLITEGSRPAIEFEGSRKVAYQTTITASEYLSTVSLVAKSNVAQYTVDSGSARLANFTFAGTDKRFYFGAGSGYNYGHLAARVGNVSPLMIYPHGTQQFLLSALAKANLTQIWFNGIQKVNTDPFEGAGAVTGQSIIVGQPNQSETGWDGSFSEVIVYQSDITSQRTAIEANLAEFYGIDLPSGFDTSNNEVDAFVTTWYDQSGNGNHATQTTATYQPKIVSDGALVTENGKAAIEFDGTDDYLRNAALSIVQPIWTFSVVSFANTNLQRVYDTDNVAERSNLNLDSTNGINITSGSPLASLELPANNIDYILTCVHNSSSSAIYVDSILKKTGDAGTNGMDTLRIGANITGSQNLNGTCQELIIYDSDQSDYRQGIETNTALYYNIFTTMKYKVQSNEVDGYVATWYDQSGNGYDAAQSTADYQPKLVSAGALITDGDEPAIEFDGSNDYLGISSSISSVDPWTIIEIKSRTGDDVNGLMIGTASSPAVYNYWQYTDNIVYARNREGDYSYGPAINDKILTFVANPTVNRSDMLVFRDSVQLPRGGSGGSVSTADFEYIGRVAANYGSGKYQELIIYPSDKSNQRQRIEGNLAWKYGIQDKLPWNHPYARSFPGFGSQRVPVDSDAIAYLTAVAEADGVGVEVPIANAIEDFILGCKSDGIWSSIKASCILAAARSLSGALVPLVGAAPTNLPVANGFAGGDYSRTAGLTGDGTSYLDSGRAGDDDPQNDRHRAMYVTVTPSLTSRAYMGHTNGTTQFDDIYHASNGFSYIRSLTSGPAYNGANETGFIGYSRASSATVDFEVFSSSATDWPHSSVTPLASNALVFGSNEPGGPGRFTDATIAFYSIGTSINLAQLDTRVSNLIASTNLYLDIGLNPDNYDQDTINYIYNAYKAGGSLA